MKIASGNAPAAAQPLSQRAPRRASDPAPSAATDAPTGVSVAVSPLAQLLSKIQASGTTDEVDQARVSRIRDALAQGTYEIDNQALARAFIDKELRWTR